MPNFAQRVLVAVNALSSNPPKDVDENDFIEASGLVYDGVREIRRAVLMNRVSTEFVRSLVENTFNSLSQTVIRAKGAAIISNALSLQTDEELDPEDIDFEDYATETKSKCKYILSYDEELSCAQSITLPYFAVASAHTGDHGVDEYPDISGITTARVRHLKE